MRRDVADRTRMSGPAVPRHPVLGGAFVASQFLALNAVGLFATAYIIRRLGPLQFGEWATAAALASAHLVVTNAGLRTIFVRDLARVPDRATDLLAAQLTLRISLGVVASGCALAVAMLLRYPPIVIGCTAVDCIWILLSVISSTFGDVLQARERFGSYSATAFLAGIVVTVSSLVAVFLGCGPIGLSIAYLSAPLVSAALYLAAPPPLHHRPDLLGPVARLGIASRGTSRRAQSGGRRRSRPGRASAGAPPRWARAVRHLQRGIDDRRSPRTRTGRRLHRFLPADQPRGAPGPGCACGQHHRSDAVRSVGCLAGAGRDRHLSRRQPGRRAPPYGTRDLSTRHRNHRVGGARDRREPRGVVRAAGGRSPRARCAGGPRRHRRERGDIRCADRDAWPRRRELGGRCQAGNAAAALVSSVQTGFSRRSHTRPPRKDPAVHDRPARDLSGWATHAPVDGDGAGRGRACADTPSPSWCWASFRLVPSRGSSPRPSTKYR